MHKFLSLLLVAVSTSAWAQGPEVPRDLQGYWVPAKASCNSDVGVLVASDSVEFRHKNHRQRIASEACFSCEGGARYSGITVWVMPTNPDPSPFTLYLNAQEREGQALVELDSPSLKTAFPLHNVVLKRCKAS